MTSAIIKDQPEVIGCSFSCSTAGTALFLLKKIKERAPSIETVIGGPGPYSGIGRDSANMENFSARCHFIDKIIYGEGELVFNQYLKEGHKGSKVISVSDFGLEPVSMDSLPYLDFSGVDLSKYLNIGIGSSRGCPFKCKFCAETKMWGEFRSMSIERITAEIRAQKRKRNGDRFFFSDSLLNHSITPLVNNLIKENIQIQFDCYLRIDKQMQDKDATDKWARGGLRRARLGMESSSESILKMMDKGICAADQAHAIENLSSSGIRTTTYWMVGAPYETEEHLRETLDFIERNKNFLYEVGLEVFRFYADGEIGLESYLSDSGRLEERFPSEFEPITLVKYYKLKNIIPEREEVLDRAVRFVNHADRLGIPCNPSQMVDLINAERRWEELQNKM